MNSYIQQSKDIILDYLSKAQQTDRKIEEGRKIYLPESMDQEEKRLRAELSKMRSEAERKLDGIFDQASREARSWGNLDGNKLTSDAQLLTGQGVTPEQFDELVTRYQDNYTMLDALRKYGERRNAEEAAKQHAAGDHFVMESAYNVSAIPSADSKLKVWQDMRDRAGYFLNVADGSGFDDEFTHTLARGTADKAFEAWGADDAPAPAIDHDANVQAFSEAWGFNK